MPNLFIIAGPNGAGKTTAAFTVLPQFLKVFEFVNADEIARGLSPFQPESIAFEAGRIMLRRLDTLLEAKADFAFETTLASKTFVGLINQAKSAGYEVDLWFYALKTASLAKSRVSHRVATGGHHIPDDVIERRYLSGIRNFQNLYAPLLTNWKFFDNSQGRLILIALKEANQDLAVLHPDLYHYYCKQIMQ